MTASSLCRIAPLRAGIWCFFLGFCSPLHAVNVSVGLGAQTRYITEGRDNLDGHSLRYTSFSAEHDAYSANLWFGAGAFNNYREWNLSVARTFQVAQHELSLGATYLLFDSEEIDEDDLEFALTYTIETDWRIQITNELYHSREANGAYATTNFALPLTKFLTPYVGFGFNAGYVDNENSGLDHWMAGFELHPPAQSKYHLALTLASTSPLNQSDEDMTVETTWLGVEFSADF